MPQLDLTWFLFNFTVAWALVTLVLSSLSNQNWKEDTSLGNDPTPNNTPTNNWRW
nr:ATP synthase F0 subunit 8 [Holothuria hilla]